MWKNDLLTKTIIALFKSTSVQQINSIALQNKNLLNKLVFSFTDKNSSICMYAFPFPLIIQWKSQKYKDYSSIKCRNDVVVVYSVDQIKNYNFVMLLCW